MKRLGIFILLLTLAFFCVGCGDNQTDARHYQLNSHVIDPSFREFYSWLGGIDNLGPAISPKFTDNGHDYQYTSTALLVFSPDAPIDQQYSLAPLGLEMNLDEVHQERNHTISPAIYPGFKEKYLEIGGFQYVGSALTEARYNPEKGRIEQYFTNLGFYLLETNPEEVALLQYGAWKCADQCLFEPALDAEVALWSSLGGDFNDAIGRLNPGFTGYPISDPYIASDSVIEQIFENVVIIADPKDPTEIRLRPIVKMVGLSGDESKTYKVPDTISQYFQQISGLEISKKPITAFQALSSEIYRQCFTDLCIDYFPNKVEGLKIRLVPIGYTYKNIKFPEEQSPDVEDIPLRP